MSDYPFENFEDEGSKGSNDLKVDAPTFTSDTNTFTTGNDSLTNPPQITDISQVQLLEQDSLPSTSHDHGDTPDKQKKGGWPKGRKRKRFGRDKNAPKQPLSGYIRFMNERRETLRQANSEISFTEITKTVSGEWKTMPDSAKQRYLDEAEKDRERYNKELEAYYKTEAYKIFKQKKMEFKKGGTEEDTNQSLNGQQESTSQIKDLDEVGTFDIPIFTEDFLDHNKNRETELRLLRKQNTEFEEQNAILSKHIENMKKAIEKLEVEAQQQRSNNMAVQQHLDALRTVLTQHFSGIPLPGSNETAKLENIDNYMNKLHSIILDNPQENENLIAVVREIVGRLNFDSEKM